MRWDVDNITVVVSFIGILGTLSSIFFAYMAFKRNTKHDIKNEGKNEGTMISDICHIKECVDRVEKNLHLVDERYRIILERVVKVEEALSNITR